ncbi:hypothetical protein [Winslowiella iniecta]|uniref:Uncharacterized protein n=1 Tax=Winslowiella iniecta TaxID=1560201 RepID=A0A0L7T195_9GAMM|nr:hypothetical protein [Winslowiella iniecta]KOC89001.1 hypothetical protein NG42_14065 [Winslowiella iniecta]KOC92648.1 hypothetical protein NG43_12890 [Winslowiella iniecta]
MGTLLALSGLVLGAWAVRGICLKQQSNASKLIKSLIAAAYFLGIGGLAGTEENKAPMVIALLLIGAALVCYSNYRDKKAG